MTGGFSSASGILAARTALDVAIRAALSGDTVDITFGPSWPPAQHAWVSQQGITSDTDPGPLGTTRHQQETITLMFEVGAWVPGSDDTAARAAFARAFGILDTIQTHVRIHDITLGGTVLWCLPGPSQSDGVADEDATGYNAIVAASFVGVHRIRTGS